MDFLDLMYPMNRQIVQAHTQFEETGEWPEGVFPEEIENAPRFGCLDEDEEEDE